MPALLPRIELESAPKPTAAVIWLHGLGASGDDFAALVPELDLTGCRAIRFIFPHAPEMPVALNGGYLMPAWYDIFGAEPGAAQTRREDAAGIAASAQRIEALIANEVARGISAQNLVLAGFSQGCALALHVALRHPEKLAGVVALSGYLPLAQTAAHERSAANAHTPIFMAHGTQDPVVAIERAQASHELLSRLGYPVQWHTYPMAHNVHPQEVTHISTFLRQVLGA